MLIMFYSRMKYDLIIANMPDRMISGLLINKRTIAAEVCVIYQENHTK